MKFKYFITIALVFLGMNYSNSEETAAENTPETAETQTVEYEEATIPTNIYTELLHQEICGYDNEKNVINKDVQKTLESYLGPTERIDPKINSSRIVKTSLLEEENNLGLRNFKFEQLRANFLTKYESFLMSDKNSIKKSDENEFNCLYFFYQAAKAETLVRAQKFSNYFKCGFKLIQQKNINELVPVYWTYKYENSTNLEEMKCQVQTPVKGQKPDDYLRNLISNFEKGDVAFQRQIDEINKHTAAKEKEAEATTCLESSHCPHGESSDVKDNGKVGCSCDVIADNWDAMGFSLYKGTRPTEKICKEMTDEDYDHCDTGKSSYQCGGETLSKCARNAIHSFTEAGFDTLLSSFDVFGWVSNISVLYHELTENSDEAIPKLISQLTGFNTQYWGCLNGYSKGQYACQIFGRVLGNSVGFSAGVGTLAGVAAKLGKIAKLKKLTPGLRASAAKGFKEGLIAGYKWPTRLTSGTVKGAKKATYLITHSALKAAEKAKIVKGPVKPFALSRKVGEKKLELDTLLKKNTEHNARIKDLEDQILAKTNEKQNLNKHIRRKKGINKEIKELENNKEVEIKAKEQIEKEIELKNNEIDAIKAQNSKRTRDYLLSIGTPIGITANSAGVLKPLTSEELKNIEETGTTDKFKNEGDKVQAPSRDEVESKQKPKESSEKPNEQAPVKP